MFLRPCGYYSFDTNRTLLNWVCKFWNQNFYFQVMPSYLNQIYLNFVANTGVYFVDGNAGQKEIEIFASMLLSSPLVMLLEGASLLNFQYSKFGVKDKSKGVSSKVGMFILYFVPLISFCCIAHPIMLNSSWYHSTIAALIVVHFSKRCLETLYIHKYSGCMSEITVAAICIFYTLFASAIAYFLVHRIDIEQGSKRINYSCFLAGLCVFATGLCGNY